MAPIISGKNFYDNLFKTKVMKKLIPANPTDMAATLALISTTTKDAVNCYYYTTQSLHNEKIPEEKRKFVAGLDLSNGILNVVVQFTLGSIVNKYSPKIFDKWFGNSFGEEAGKKLYKKIVKSGVTNWSEKSVIEGLSKRKKIAEGGFKVIAVLLVTQVIAKRIITPLLATPMAGIFKEQLEKREKLHPELKAVKTEKTEKEDDDDDDDDKIEAKETDVKEVEKNVEKPEEKAVEQKTAEQAPAVEAKAEPREENIFNSLASKNVKFAKP